MLFSFKKYVLDTDRRELRGPQALVDLEPQVFDLLEYLVRQRDHVVTRDELIDKVWGGRIVSESTLATRINAARRAIGDDGTKQALIKTISRRGVRFIGDVREGAAAPDATPASPPRGQSVTFCRTSDGVNIAVGSVGDGPVLLKSANWLSHLELDWQSPIWSPLIARLAERFRFIRYDGRGNGLADHDVTDISLDGFGRDLDAVVSALNVDRFAMLGMSQGASIAIAHAVRHPERITHLILYGAYAQGRNKRGDEADREKAQTLLAMMRQGWGDESSAFMRAFSSIYLPNATTEQIKWFADMQRASTSAALAARLRNACDDIDVLDLLPRISVPTLVLHARNDNVVPFEQGRAIAAAIPRAEFVSLDSENHILLPGEPAWERLIAEIENFAGAA